MASMSKQLNELLDDLKDWINCPLDEIERYGVWELETDQSKELLDYINSLQQENQQLKEELNTCMIERNKLVDVIDEAIDTINNMINIGYTKDLTGYFPTVLNSEFGIRALIIKEILQKYKGDNK